ncbi:MAG: ATP-grasp domain-containing protein [Flavobacteriaceae bacterium]|nr:ATP-grasp domain-containing protein [Flavobacteriaceae bacterium]
MSSRGIQNVGIFYGGYGPEFKISESSARFVKKALSPIGWKLFLVEVSSSGYRAFDADDNVLGFDSSDFSIIQNSQKQIIDVAFNSIHGPPGEDGQLAKLFDHHQIAHTSSNSQSAELTFDKRKCLDALQEIGVKRAKYDYLDFGESISIEQISQNVGFPCFVKASRSGSSFGVYRVENQTELPSAINKAFKYDHKLLIEQALVGIEVSVGVFQWKDQIKVLPTTELVPHSVFFDYKAKYEGQSDEITPARISQELTMEIQSIAKKIYRFLNLRGATRSEFIICDQEIHLLEVNTVPGFTQVSILPQQVRAAGIGLTDFFATFVEQSIQ